MIPPISSCVPCEVLSGLHPGADHATLSDAVLRQPRRPGHRVRRGARRPVRVLQRGESGAALQRSWYRPPRHPLGDRVRRLRAQGGALRMLLTT